MDAITEEEVRTLIHAWFDAVRDKLPLNEQKQFFAPGVDIDVWTGDGITLEQQFALHENLTDESHAINTLTLEPEAGDRVRAVADVRWEATKTIGDKGRIVADAGEDWTCR